MIAGLVPDPRLYPHGSARWYAKEAGPIWLERLWVESSARAGNDAARYRPEDYVSAFGGTVPPALQRLVERRLELPAGAEDPLDDLLGAAPERVAAWMRRKAALADGTAIGLPVCDVQLVRDLVARAREAQGEWTIRSSQKATDAWPQVAVALARDVCAATFAEAGGSAEVTEGGAWKLYGRHQQCLAASDEYAARVATLAKELMENGCSGRSR